MNKQENKKVMMVPLDENKGIVMLPPGKTDLIVPPTPLSRDDMLKISGGVDRNKTPGIDVKNL